jgi:hypothetical protein
MTRPALRASVPAICALFVFAFSSEAQARCSRQPVRFGGGVPTASTVWKVWRGTNCRSALRPGLAALLGLSLARPAQHGVAGVASRYQYGYQPDAGYTGPDSFVLKIDFDDRGRHETTLLTVNVIVQ